MNTTIMLLVVAAIAVGILFPQLLGASSNQISPTEANRLVDEGALVVDVRTPMEFAQGHINGAVNIPVQELSRRLEEFGAKDRDIVLYCRSGNRSSQARQMLVREGFTAVHDAGAINRWASARPR
jgi:phage shock protein E